MKRLNEYTEAELLALDDESTSRLIDLECACEGVPLLPPNPGSAPVNNLPAPDTKCYLVGGVITVDADHAARIFEAITSSDIYELTYKGKDYSEKYLKVLPADNYNFPSMKTETHRSLAQYDAIADDREVFAAAKKAWDSLNSEYQAAQKARLSVSSGVYAAIREASDKNHGRERLRSMFAKYLELSDGNRMIALNFLKQVEDLSDFPELPVEFVPVDTEASE